MREKLRPYLQATPDIFCYVFVSKVILLFAMLALGGVVSVLLKSVGRVAVTSGDWKFLYSTWQGILILLLSLLSLYICVAFDLNGKIALCSSLVKGEAVSIRECLTKGITSTLKLLSPGGLLVVLYISFVAPVIGLGFSTSATDGLYIPTFITSFIQESVLYSSLLGIIVPILLIIGIANLYILHGVVLDGLSVKDSNRQSYRIMRSNYKNYIKENVLFFLALGAVIALIAAITIAVPLVLTQLIPMPPACYRFLVVLFITAGALVYLYVDLFMIPLYFMKMTQLYYRYKYDMVFENRVAEEKRRRFNRVLASLWAAAFLAAVISQFVCFDTWYPAESNVGIIAHRAGGVEAPENTVAGIETAYKIGADGCEIDIQRTKDGFYVLNHDADFKRTAGEKKTPEEMDLREIKELRVDGEPVAEFEETLAAAKGKLTLYTELKGNTADKKMADDAVRLIHKYGMEDECVLISLKYDLIDYIQTEYPDIETGFLTFAAFGNTPDLNCDCIGLEAESATAYKVETIHQENKKALVWTVNEKSIQRHFLSSEADGIITDNVAQAVDVKEALASRSDLARMLDRVRVILTSTM